jgi:hypothetical protein
VFSFNHRCSLLFPSISLFRVPVSSLQTDTTFPHLWIVTSLLSVFSHTQQNLTTSLDVYGDLCGIRRYCVFCVPSSLWKCGASLYPLSFRPCPRLTSKDRFATDGLWRYNYLLSGKERDGGHWTRFSLSFLQTTGAKTVHHNLVEIPFYSSRSEITPTATKAHPISYKVRIPFSLLLPANLLTTFPITRGDKSGLREEAWVRYRLVW